eukprot:1686965-Rhodomonas_salina.1
MGGAIGRLRAPTPTRTSRGGSKSDLKNENAIKEESGAGIPRSGSRRTLAGADRASVTAAQEDTAKSSGQPSQGRPPKAAPTHVETLVLPEGDVVEKSQERKPDSAAESLDITKGGAAEGTADAHASIKDQIAQPVVHDPAQPSPGLEEHEASVDNAAERRNQALKEGSEAMEGLVQPTLSASQIQAADVFSNEADSSAVIAETDGMVDAGKGEASCSPHVEDSDLL